MEDRGIAEIEKAAHDYVDARDARMSMGEEEKRRHTKMLGVMQKHGKTKYLHNTGSEVIEVNITPKDATAKARVKITPTDEYRAAHRDKEEPEIESGEPELDVDDQEPDDEEPDDDEFDVPAALEGDEDLDEDQP